ncbi:hypothetical protein BY458DRAFT_518952 [Sporodiniella umbellata]|nr:hypothetical protein BY458DRAFT_518952 [Sporodiniella umbellata]
MRTIGLLTAVALFPLFGSLVANQDDWNGDDVTRVTTSVTVTVWNDDAAATEDSVYNDYDSEEDYESPFDQPEEEFGLVEDPSETEDTSENEFEVEEQPESPEPVAESEEAPEEAVEPVVEQPPVPDESADPVVPVAEEPVAEEPAEVGSAPPKPPVLGFTEKEGSMKPTKAYKTPFVPETKTSWTPEVTGVTGKSSTTPIISCKGKSEIALTYSEGPTEASVKIAQQLSEFDAKANFFVNSTWLTSAKHETILQNLHSAGHLIGMTYRAKNDKPEDMSDEQLEADMIENARRIQKVIGVAPKYVRLHSATKDPRIDRILANLGFVTVGYNLDSEDYIQKKATGPGSIQEFYQQALAREKGASFIAVHYDVPQSSSVNAVRHIVKAITDAGFSLVRLDNCLADSNPYKMMAESPIYVHDPISSVAKPTQQLPKGHEPTKARQSKVKLRAPKYLS